MKDILKDLVQSLGNQSFDIVKVTTTEEGTLFESVNKEKTVILKAKAKTAVTGMPVGVFGLSNLKMLQGTLSLPSFKDGLDITIEDDDMTFKSPQGKINYRLTPEPALPNQPAFHEPKWSVEVSPTKSKYAELQTFANVMGSVASKFQPDVADGILTIYFGANKSTHNGFVEFAEVDSSVNQSFSSYWPVAEVLSVLSLVNNGECSMQIMPKAMQIKIDTGLIEYSFIFPSHIDPDR